MQLSPPSIFLALLYLRVLAEAADVHLGTRLAAPATLLLLCGLGLLFTIKPVIKREARWIAGAFAFLLAISALSMATQEMTDQEAAASTLLLNAVFMFSALAGAALFRRPENLEGLFRFTKFFVMFGTTLAVFQIATGTGLAETGRSAMRAFGASTHPVPFGMQIVISLVLAEVCRVKLGLKPTSVYKAVVLIGFVGLYLSLARTAWAMAAIIGGMYVVMAARGPVKLVLIPAFIGGMVLLVFYTDRFADLGTLPRFFENTAFDAPRYDYRSVESSMAWRILNWVLHYQMAWDRPILGFGPGQSISVSMFGLGMHNAFLQYFLELGLLGLLGLVGLIFSVIMAHRGIRRNMQSRYVRALVFGLSLALLFSMASSVSFLDQTMGVVFYILTITVAASPMIESGRVQKPRQIQQWQQSYV